MRSPAPPPHCSLPGWDPASWGQHLPRLDAGDASSLDVKSLAAAELLVPTFAGPWIPLPLLLDRLVVTHRLSAAELAGGFLELDPDLSLLYEPVRDGVVLLGGGGVRQGTIAEVIRMGLPFDRRVALGPDGWLDGFADGELGAFFLDGGMFHVATATVDPPVHRRRARQLRRMLQQMQEDAHRRGTPVADGAPFAVTVRELLRELLTADDTWFTDVEPPASVLIAASGLHTEYGWVAEPDVDLAPYAPSPECPVSVPELVGDTQVDPADVDELESAVMAQQVGLLRNEPEHLRRLGNLFADSDLLGVFFVRTVLQPAVTPFLKRVLPYVDGAAATGVRRLLAWHAGADGHGDAAGAGAAP